MDEENVLRDDASIEDLTRLSESGDDDAESQVTLLPYMDLPLDTNLLRPSFDSLDALNETLKTLAETLQEVAVKERDQLISTKNTFTQFLIHMTNRPSIYNGERLKEFISLIRNSLELRSSWPKEPLPDLRVGSILEAKGQIVFDHGTEGLIRLEWVNPLPTPEWMASGGYRCDACLKENLLVGYQHVTEDNARDQSVLLAHRIGYDVCASCAIDSIVRHRRCVLSWLRRVQRGTLAHLMRPTCNIAPELELQLHFSQSGGANAAEVSLKGTSGLFAAVAILPVLEDAEELFIPTSWLGFGRKFSDELFVTSPPSWERREVEFVTASGDVVQISTERRGVLLYNRKPKSAEMWGETVSVKAITFVESKNQQPDADSTNEQTGSLSFQGVGEVAVLPAEESFRILEELHALASGAGVVHNIPRRCPLDGRKANASMCDDLCLSSSSNASGRIQTLAETSGVAKGFFGSSSWSELGDCVICLDALHKETWVRGAPVRTTCGHIFHAACLRKYMRGRDSRDANCPNCRAPNPLQGADRLGACETLRLTLTEDVRGQPLDSDTCFRVLAVLCQDLEAIVDTALLMSCCVLQAGDPNPSDIGITMMPSRQDNSDAAADQMASDAAP